MANLPTLATGAGTAAGVLERRMLSLTRLALPFNEPSFRLGKSPRVLDEIHEEGVNVAIWERPSSSSLAEVLRAWSARRDPHFDSMVLSSGYSLLPVFEGVPPGAARDWLLSDVAMLLGRFIAVTRAPRFRLFFGAIGDDQCPKFHVDYVRLRMIATYVGPGTEWLPDDAVRREAMENSPECPDLANAAVMRDPASVRHARAGHVVMLKGVSYSGVKERAAVHRSPPMKGATEKRIALIATARER